MDNKTLDSILVKVKESGTVPKYDFIRTNRDLAPDLSSAVQLLIQRGYLYSSNDGNKHILGITAEGERLLTEGGFSSDAQYREETLQVAKDSKKYAKWALIVSVIGVIISIVLFILDGKK